MPAEDGELEDNTDDLDDGESELRDDELLTEVRVDDDIDDVELDEIFDVDDGNKDEVEDLELLDLLDTIAAQAEPVTTGFSAALPPLFPCSPNSIVCPGFTILFQLKFFAE